MASTINTILALLESQVQSGTTSAATDPTQAQMLQYISLSIRKIAREDRPQEIVLATPVDHAITVNTNSVSLDSSILTPTQVYYNSSGNNYLPLNRTTVENIITSIGPTNYFDTSNIGDPTMFALQGNKLIFDQYFNRTDSTALKVFGIEATTEYSASDITASTVIELPIDYNMLIVFEAALLFYQKDEDAGLIRQYFELAKDARARIAIALTDNHLAVEMDPQQFAVAYPFSSSRFLWGS